MGRRGRTPGAARPGRLAYEARADFSSEGSSFRGTAAASAVACLGVYRALGAATFTNPALAGSAAAAEACGLVGHVLAASGTTLAGLVCSVGAGASLVIRNVLLEGSLTSDGWLGTVARAEAGSSVALENVLIKTPVTVKSSAETRAAAAVGGATGNAAITLTNVVARLAIDAKFSLHAASLVGNVLDSNITISGSIRSEVTGQYGSCFVNWRSKHKVTNRSSDYYCPLAVVEGAVT